MFLISKIVRGRRLLHELEAEAARREADEANKLAEAAAKAGALTPRRSQQRSTKLSTVSGVSTPSTSRAESQPGGTSPVMSARRRKTIRQKTETSLPDDEEIQPAGDGRPPLLIRRTSSMPSVNDVMKSGRLFYNYDRKLNKMQKRSLRFTWQRLQTRNGGKKVESVFEEVFERLLKQHPVMRDMFTTRTFLSAMSKNSVATLRDHAKITVKMVDNAIKSFDMDARRRSENSELEPRYIGRAHGKLRPYGFIGNYWEKLGETIIDVVLAQEAVRDLPGAGQAWVVFTACIVDQLRVGFDESRNFGDDLLARKSSISAGLLQEQNSLDSTDSNILEYIPENQQYDITADAAMNSPVQCPYGESRRWSRNEVQPPNNRTPRHDSSGRNIRRGSSKEANQQCRTIRSGSSVVSEDLTTAQDTDSYL